ncbi:SMI1/KNR4 family protein [Bradyrhizobium sp. AC87j1]|uniref:SMI1/KNR4 family protein n=1 Tax=Bradyrhizobium sp. AC87j1 TaxID=2055894 RepID=UPI0011B04C0D|nr:SMI1/KNR4 family protein [Bradyrhizobium sp. AC87j1]
MSLESLARKLVPPLHPLEASGDWTSIEGAMGVVLPNDFKQFIGAYGSGVIGDFLTILNPFSTRPGLNLPQQSRRQLDVLHALQDTFGEQVPFELYPIEGGLLPIGITDNGDVIHWLTSGGAADWTVFVNEARSPDYEHFPCCLTQFIEGVIERSIRCRAFPLSIFQAPPAFRSL